mgnify:CR=1 FL=1|tara:strand:- start:120 stop:398 length:279 start_codon:yes stop_codon:yes gene_type:complete
MIYSATFGLAGPASAMVQSQCVVHTVLATIFLGDIPQALDIIGIACAITGAVVMSVDIDLSCLKSKANREELLSKHGHTNKSQKTVSSFYLM